MRYSPIVYGAVLAGGRSSRMVGQHKANTLLEKRPLLNHVVERIQPQVQKLAINTAPALEINVVDCEFIHDIVSGYHGPLMGLWSCMSNTWFCADYLAIVPCDAPLLPSDLIMRLSNFAQKNNLKAAAVRYNGQVEPMFSIWHKDALFAIESTLREQKNGGLKFMINQLGGHFYDWPETNDNPFFNVNTNDDLDSLKGKFSK